MNKPRVLALDLDGTLVDSLDDITAALARSMPAPALPRDEVRRFVGRGARHLVEEVLRFRNLPCGAADVDDALARFRLAYDDVLCAHTRAYEGILAALDALRELGLVLVVTTNKPSVFAARVVAHCLGDRIDVVLGPEDAGATKPDPAMLVVAAARGGGTLVGLVGDSLVDVETARAAGVPAIGVGWGLGDPGEVEAAADTFAARPDQLVAAVRAALDGAGPITGAS